MGLEVNILIVSWVPVGTSNLPLPGQDPENLLARGIGTRRLESGGASREKSMRGADPLSLAGEVKEDSSWIF